MNFDKEKIDFTSDPTDLEESVEYVILSSCDLIPMSGTSYESGSVPSDPTEKWLSKNQFSTIRQYEEEWNELYCVPELNLEKLRQKSEEGHLRTSLFRSVCWRCLLGILHRQPKQWLCQLQMYRKHYREMCIELENNPWSVKGNIPHDNPLSQESESIWQKYFCDEELKAVIRQDVKRTFPDIDFYKTEEIQQIMVRILFCYARQNPALCYRQGMHEILAPLIFVLYCDHQAFLHAKELNPSLDNDLSEILSPDDLEQDAFSMFKYIMNHLESSYRINNSLTTSAGYFPSEIQKLEDKTYQNEAIARLDYIKKNILQPKDPKLNDHLEKLDIHLHLFGIRWLRLLFGSEFPMQDLLVLWDFIFANNFETVNYVVVSMLIAIRHILLNGDYTVCLSNLMRYPNEVEVTFIIGYALHLKDPQKYPAPIPTRNLICPPNRNFSAKNKSSLNQKSESLEFSPVHSSRSKKGPKSMQWFPSKSNLLTQGRNGDGDGSVVQTPVTDDPILLKAELEQSNVLMNVVYQKLVNLHSVLVTNLKNNASAEVQLALDGISELSRLLESHLKEISCEVETACEAGEIKETAVNPNVRPTKQLSKIDKQKPSVVSINSESRSHTLPKIKKNPKSGELKVFNQQFGGPLIGAPMTDPLHLIKNLSREGSMSRLCTSE